MTDDVMIATMANQNPKLSHISLQGIRLTEAAFSSLAQLQHLTIITLRVFLCETVLFEESAHP